MTAKAPTVDIDLAIIIVSYNVEKYLIKCLRSIKNTITDLSFHLVVVDNCSSDRSASIVKTEYPGCTLIQTDRNIGFGRAVNIAAREICAKYFLILNPDTEITNDIVKIMIAHMKEYPSVGVVGCRMINTDGSIQPQTYSLEGLVVVFANLMKIRKLMKYRYFLFAMKMFKWIPPVKEYIDYEDNINTWMSVERVPGSGFLIDGELFQKIGGFDESFFLYYEDADIFFRIHEKEKREIHLLSQIGIVHHLEKSFSSEFPAGSPCKYWSMLYYFRKNHGLIKYSIVAFLLFSTTSIKYIVTLLSRPGNAGGHEVYLRDCIIVMKMSLFGLKNFDPFAMTGDTKTKAATE